MNVLEKLAQGKTVLLDGATGTELERRGVPMDSTAWSGLAMDTHPDVVRQVHADYLAAGADVIITNTFATARHVLVPAGAGDRVRELNLRAVDLVREAIASVDPGRDVLIAGSISTFAPGSDYSRLEAATARESYQEQADLLAEAGVDVLALEMLRDLEQSSYALEAAKQTGVPVWAGLTVRRNAEGALVLREGREDIPLWDGVRLVAGHAPQVIAVMHSDLEDTGDALAVVRRHWDGLLGAYPHSGYFTMPHWHFDSVVSEDDFVDAALGWLAAGATLLGACCGIGPAHIARLAHRLPAHS